MIDIFNENKGVRRVGAPLVGAPAMYTVGTRDVHQRVSVGTTKSMVIR